MMRLLSVKSLVISTVLSAPFFSFAEEALFRFEGKDYTQATLPPAAKQQIFDAEKQRFDVMSQVIQRVVVQQYVEEEAKKQKKTPLEVEQKLFASSIGEKEAKKWFDENKDRLGGRTFDSIKTEIIGYLQAQAREQIAKNLVEQLKKEKKLTFNLTAPVPPVIEINASGFPRKGNEKSKVKIVEFADYRCPHCKHAADVMKGVLEKLKDKVEFTFMDYPLQVGGVSTQVAEGAVCASAQNKFWEYHYMAFDKQQSLSPDSPQDFAKQLSLDAASFSKCLADPATKAKVLSARHEGERIGIDATPSIFINGVKYTQALDEASITSYVKSLL